MLLYDFVRHSSSTQRATLLKNSSLAKPYSIPGLIIINYECAEYRFFYAKYFAFLIIFLSIFLGPPNSAAILNFFI